MDLSQSKTHFIYMELNRQSDIMTIQKKKKDEDDNK